MRKFPSKAIAAFLLSLALAGQAPVYSMVYAEEGQEEDSGDDEAYIPDEYYEPIQSNEVSGWPQGQAIQASAGIVMDLDTGAILYAKNIQRQLYPASITKIMTALLTLENCSPDDVVTCTDAVYELDDNASNIALQEGEQMTVKDTLYALMLESANDAANALAVHISGSISAFADLMNQRARDIGCTVTHFANPSGLTNEAHYTCARDFALIASAAYSREDFRRIISTTEYEIGPTNLTEEPRVFANHHKMIHKESDFYQSQVTGGKTGYTEAAWNTLVTFGEKDGMRLVCVLLHGNGAEQNYRETADLLNYGFDSFTHLQPAGTKSSYTLGDLMKASYLGEAKNLSAPELDQTAVRIDGTGLVTVPAGTKESVLTSAPFKGQAGTNDLAGEFGTISGQNAEIGPVEGAFYYTYKGWPVGSRRAEVGKVSLDLTIPWQVQTRVTMTSGQGDGQDKEEEAQKANAEAWANMESYVKNLDQKRQDFAQSHRTGIILTVGCILIAILLLLLVALVRTSRNVRMRKKMRQAQEEARRREEEIEKKTAVEIEEELRAAMKAQGQTPEERSIQDLEREASEREKEKGAGKG